MLFQLKILNFNPQMIIIYTEDTSLNNKCGKIPANETLLAYNIKNSLKNV
jgi:hypothetical protein